MSHRIEIPHRRIVVEIPSEINEMNQDQFVFFVKQILRCTSGEISLEEFRTLVTCHFLGIRKDFRYYNLPREEKDQIHSQINRVASLMDGFFEEQERDGKKQSVFRLDLVKNLIPRIGRYYGPEDGMTNITFFEYRTVHNLLLSYLKTQDEEDLNRMIAVLYRRKKLLLPILRLLPWYDGQQRVPITAKSNPVLFERRAKKIARLPLEIRYGIFLFISGCEEFLSKGSPLIDGITVDLSILYEKSTDEEGESKAPIGLVGLLFSLAESKVFGSISETDNQNLYDILLRLYQVVLQMNEMKSKHGTHKTV